MLEMREKKNPFEKCAANPMVVAAAGSNARVFTWVISDPYLRAREDLLINSTSVRCGVISFFPLSQFLLELLIRSTPLETNLKSMWPVVLTL